MTAVLIFVSRSREGTEILAGLKPGDKLELEGPFGTGFPHVEGKVALVGGGIGIAPLYYCAQELPESDIYLGFSRESFVPKPSVRLLPS